MLHQSAFKVNAQSTDAFDFARRNSQVKASKGSRQALAFGVASAAMPAFETLSFRISSPQGSFVSHVEMPLPIPGGACRGLKGALC